MRPAPNCTSAVSSKSSSKSHSYLNLEFDGYHRVGFIRSAHGIRGEVHVQLFAGQADWEAEELFLVLPGTRELKKFALVSERPHKDGLIAVLEGIQDRNAAEAIAKSPVYVSNDVLVSEEGEQIFLHEILQFDVVDPHGAILGRIESFQDNGAQDLLEVRTSKGLSLVPFVDDFIVEIDFDKKQVRMDLPPGLIDPED
jgi:16S rRNA processing protein RimM